MSGPNVRLSTKWPSMTSRWSRSTPARSSLWTTRSRRPKSAFRMLAAMRIGRTAARLAPRGTLRRRPEHGARSRCAARAGRVAVARRPAPARPAWSAASCPQAAPISTPRLRRTVVCRPAARSACAKASTRSIGDGQPRGVGDRVHRDEVDMREAASEQRRRSGRVRGRVVDAVDHDHLVGHAPPGPLGVPRRRVHDLLDGPAPVERHEHVPQLRARRVERDRERVLATELGEPLDAGHDAARADGDVPLAQPEAPLVGERLAGRDDRLGVEERLAHAHEHDVRQAPPLARERVAPEARLVDDLRGREVAPEAQLPGGAERAADGAAGLARDAQRRALATRAARRVAHEDRLDDPAVVEAVERLRRSARHPPRGSRSRRACRTGSAPRESARSAPGSVWISSNEVARAGPDVVRDLACAEGGLAPIREPAEQLGRSHAGDTRAWVTGARRRQVEERHGAAALTEAAALAGAPMLAGSTGCSVIVMWVRSLAPSTVRRRRGGDGPAAGQRRPRR